MNVAYDLDGVLGNTTKAFIAFMNKNGQPEWKEENITDYSLENCFNVTEAYIVDSFNRFFRENNIAIQPMYGAVNGIHKVIQQGSRVSVLSSRNPTHQQSTIEWIRMHFGGLFDGIYCLGSGTDKGKVMDALGIDVLLDDQPDYANQAERYGGRGIIFDQPWNKDSLLTRVHSHAEFAGWLQQQHAEEARSRL